MPICIFLLLIPASGCALGLGPATQKKFPMKVNSFVGRQNAVAVCADIQEMFQQIKIQPEDRCAERFLWRDHASKEPPDVYEMLVMTFGAACSPCSAHYVKVKNAVEHTDCDPRAIRAITDYHYVDDYEDSFPSASEAIRISQQVKGIHSDAGFQLRKFGSSGPEIVTALDGETTMLPFKSKESMESGNVLGMMWEPSDDQFTYRLEFYKVDARVMWNGPQPTKPKKTPSIF